MNRTSKFSIVGLLVMLASLVSIPVAIWQVKHTIGIRDFDQHGPAPLGSGEFDQLGVFVFHILWGGLLCLAGAVLSVVGLFRPPRTRLSWVSFNVAVCFALVFTWLACSPFF